MLPNRIRIISYFMLAIALVLVVKLYSVQIIHYSDFSEKADRQYQRPSGTIFNRGTIYFQSKDGQLISAATLKTGFTVSINPRTIQAPIAINTSKNSNSDNSANQTAVNPNSGDQIEEIYKQINAIIPIDHDTFIQKANKQNDSYEEIAKHIDEDSGLKIDALKLPGVSIYKDRWRYYPGGELASHVLGFMGYNNNKDGTDNDYTGRYGLEKYYDDVLKRDSDDLYTNFFAEIFSNIHNALSSDQKMEGDLVTTIEPDTQKYLEDTLSQIQKKYSSESTGGIIMDPKTGAIYAMAKVPTFDPNNLKAVSDISVLSNDLVENVYEMGSIIKPLTMSVGVDVGRVTASTTYDDKGFVKVDDRTIYNFDKKGRGVIPLLYAMAKSLNTGFVFVEQQIGNALFSQYFQNFGLGMKTGIDLPNEATGLINNLKHNRDVEFVTAAFGQGIAISPIETIRAEAAIANGGYLVTPHIVQKINYRIGYSKNVEPPAGDRVISENTALAVTRMLVNNVDTSLLNGKSKNDRYSIAAKTGTAQIASPSTGGYLPDEYLHSFIGYLPAYNPRFIVFMYTYKPKGVSYASETLAQPFIDMTKYLINYYQLAPDRGEDSVDTNDTSSTSTTAVITPRSHTTIPTAKVSTSKTSTSTKR
jgi:cell division protein FtsI/penicillin-binding protein 2